MGKREVLASSLIPNLKNNLRPVSYDLIRSIKEAVFASADKRFSGSSDPPGPSASTETRTAELESDGDSDP